MNETDAVAQGDVNSTEKGSGARRNGGKIALSLVPFHLLAGCCRVFMGGKLKYAEWNWAKGMKWSSCFDCMLRHLFKWWYCGEDIDPESGEHHLHHCMCNLLMLIHYVDNYKDGDDRPPAHTFFSDSLADFNKKFDEEDFRQRTGYATPREPSEPEMVDAPLHVEQPFVLGPDQKDVIPLTDKPDYSDPDYSDLYRFTESYLRKSRHSKVDVNKVKALKQRQIEEYQKRQHEAGPHAPRTTTDDLSVKPPLEGNV